MELFSRRRYTTGSAQQSNITTWADTSFIYCYQRASCYGFCTYYFIFSIKWDTSLPKLGTMNSPRKAHEPRSKIFKAQRSVKISLFEAISMIFKVKQRKGHCPDGSNDLCRDMLHRRIPIPFQFSFGLSVFFFSLSLTQMDMINRRIPYSIWIYLWTGTYFFT